MASTRRKAAAVALAVVGIAGLSLAAAAQLNINSSKLAAGSISVVGCDTDVDVDYTVSGSTVTDVVLSDVDANCNGAAYSMQLTTLDTDDVTLIPLTNGAASGTSLAVASNTATIHLATAVAVADVDGIAIVLH